VVEALAALGVTDVKQAGRVVGHLMKGHKDELDAGLVSRLVKEALGGGG
jgi:uncharacterized protein YqeY